MIFDCNDQKTTTDFSLPLTTFRSHSYSARTRSVAAVPLFHWQSNTATAWAACLSWWDAHIEGAVLNCCAET